jgi:flagellar basal-body rod protein FlgB
MLDYRAEKHKVIVSNVANMDTESYKPVDLVFEKTLEDAMVAGTQGHMIKTHNKHFDASQDKGNRYQIVESDGKVDVDKAMSDLAENNLMYNLTVELLARKFNSLNTVLKEGK